jgi:hypothetical protein
MHSGQHGSGRIIKYAHSSTSSSQLLTPVTDSLAFSPQKHSLSAVCGRYCPTASRRPRANPSRARQWTVPPSTTEPARATRSRRSRLHRGEPRRLSSKGPARDHQRLPYRMVPRRSVSDQRGPTPFTRRRSWPGPFSPGSSAGRRSQPSASQRRRPCAPRRHGWAGGFPPCRSRPSRRGRPSVRRADHAWACVSRHKPRHRRKVQRPLRSRCSARCSS